MIHQPSTNLVIARCNCEDLVAALRQSNRQSACREITLTINMTVSHRGMPTHGTQHHVFASYTPMLWTCSSARIPVTSPRPPVFDQGPTSADTNTMLSGGAPVAVSDNGAPNAGVVAAVTVRRRQLLHTTHTCRACRLMVPYFNQALVLLPPD